MCGGIEIHAVNYSHKQRIGIRNSTQVGRQLAFASARDEARGGSRPTSPNAGAAEATAAVRRAAVG